MVSGLFCIMIIAALWIDLKFAMKKEGIFSIKEPFLWTLFWVGLSLVFGAVVYQNYGSASAMEFFTAYIIEKSLSIDNLFVFLIILSGMKLTHFQERQVLFYGIIGAIFLRGAFIWVGLELISHFSWMLYIFGGMLVYMGVRIFLNNEEPVLKMNPKFKVNPLIYATLLIIWADIIFAVDSIPAVIAITKDPFIAYTSNVFAILGLRSLFFVIKLISNKLKFVKFAIAVVTIFVGIKMLIDQVYHIPILFSCMFIFAVLFAGIGVSLYMTRGKT